MAWSGSSRKPLSLSLYGQGECVGGALDELTLSCRPGQLKGSTTATEQTLALVGVAGRWVALRAVEDPDQESMAEGEVSSENV